MKLRNHTWLATALVVGLIIGACSPPPQAVAPTTATPPGKGITRDEAVARARAELAPRLGVDPVALLVESVSPQVWSNACLSLPKPGEACVDQVTPGYVVSLRYQGRPYHYHVTDTAVRFNNLISAELPEAPPAAPEQLAQEELVRALGVSADEIQVDSVERRFWPDTGLGLARRGEPTQEGITMGAVVELSYQGQRYIYHVAGDIVRFNETESAPLP